MPELSRLADVRLLEDSFSLHSPNAIATRRVFVKSLLWFLNYRSYETCGTVELRQFFSYIADKRLGNTPAKPD